MILKDKVSVITGGATGIGKATVETFALQGAKVIFCDVNKNEGEKTQKELHKKGLKTYFVKADVSKEKDIINLYKYVTKNFKALDTVFNNAGIIAHNAPPTAPPIIIRGNNQKLLVS